MCNTYLVSYSIFNEYYDDFKFPYTEAEFIRDI